jgi:hypothetical protein
MADPIRNPDGTLQVAPPIRSAFAPQPGGPAPPAPPVQGGPTAATPEAQGAIHALIAALASAFAPKAITQMKGRTDQAIDDASGGRQPLGNELSQ